MAIYRIIVYMTELGKLLTIPIPLPCNVGVQSQVTFQNLIRAITQLSQNPLNNPVILQTVTPSRQVRNLMLNLSRMGDLPKVTE